VAADMDQDGIDDIGYFTPDRVGGDPGEGAEWFFLISNDPQQNQRVNGTVATLDHPYSPIPFGHDVSLDFGD
jgi:hypothetical protein